MGNAVNLTKFATESPGIALPKNSALPLLLGYALLVFAIEPAFFSISNLGSLVYYTCLVTPAVLGVQLLIILGLFDLSVGAIAALSGVVFAVSAQAAFSGFACVLAALVVGGLSGGINWLLVARWRINPLIGTMITMGAARACALAFSDGQVVGGVPAGFGEILLGRAGLSSPVVPCGILLVGLFELLSRNHLLFARLYQLGSNPQAGADCGVNVSHFKALVFLVCALGAACTGVLQCVRTLSASPLIFGDLALDCIAACVIGGTRLSGGKGRPVGAFLGMLIVVTSRNLAVLAGVGVYWKELAIAVVLLTAVLLQKEEGNPWKN